MKNKTFTTTLIPLNQLNGNGRIYQDNENLRQSIEDFNKRVEGTGVVYGELGYPEISDSSLSKMSHTIKNVRIEDDKVVGDITLINTPKGRILQESFKHDNPGIVFRPRSIGTINADRSVNISKLLSYDAILESEDAFSANACERYVERQRRVQIGKRPDDNTLIEGRIISELDPYGEENWNN